MVDENGVEMDVHKMDNGFVVEVVDNFEIDNFVVLFEMVKH